MYYNINPSNIDLEKSMFVQMLLMLSQIALAEPTKDSTEKVEAEINEADIQAFYEAKKEEDTAITVDMLEEEDFEMDLSALSTPVVTLSRLKLLMLNWMMKWGLLPLATHHSLLLKTSSGTWTSMKTSKSVMANLKSLLNPSQSL